MYLAVERCAEYFENGFRKLGTFPNNERCSTRTTLYPGNIHAGPAWHHEQTVRGRERKKYSRSHVFPRQKRHPFAVVFESTQSATAWAFTRACTRVYKTISCLEAYRYFFSCNFFFLLLFFALPLVRRECKVDGK